MPLLTVGSVLLERVAQKLRLALLPAANERETRLIAELRQTIGELPRLTPEQPEVSAEGMWTRTRIALRDKIISDDPRRFLNWEVIKNTMFFCDASQTSIEFESLRENSEWENRWQKSIRESDVGLPTRFVAHQESSCNLIHQAYHLRKFEEHTGRRIEEFETIVEFGGGYGSMCRLAHQLGFTGRYVILDLPELSALQLFYLKLNNINTAGHLVPEAGVVCLSTLSKLADFLATEPIDLFIANWSLSEVSLKLRNEVLKLVSGARNFVMGYQDHFGEIDNREFFASWTADQPAVSWTNVQIAHLLTNNYLIGKRDSGTA